MKWSHNPIEAKSPNTKGTVHFLIGKKVSAPAFSPQDSDLLFNAFLSEQIVGTLVRLSPSGRYESYLAEKWTVSEDNKIWEFQFRQGCHCEDGTEINASNYVDGLKKSLRILTKYSELPILDQLHGWREFKNGSPHLTGLEVASVNTLRFRFDSKPSSGFLEYLGLPYLGFYCVSDFNPDGTWRDPKRVTSSAAYRLDKWDGSFPVHLVKREGWFSLKKNSPEKLVFESDPYAEAVKKVGPRTVLYEHLDAHTDRFEGFQMIRSLPTRLTYIILNPKRLLSDVSHRQAIRDAINRVKKKTPFDFVGAQMSETIYPHLGNPPESQASLRHTDFQAIKKPITILHGGGTTKAALYLKLIAEEAMKELGVPYKLVEYSKQKGHMEGWNDESSFDLKLGIVDVGGGIENQLIKFMFCSKLGVGFPDPSGRVCRLVEKVEKESGDVLTEKTMKSYIQELNQSLFEDAAVVPILHSGPTWIVSDDIDMSGFSPTMGVPYFDQIEIK